MGRSERPAHTHDTKERQLLLLKTPMIGVPDLHPALFEYGLYDLGSKAHRWAPMIEELVDDRVIWASEFDAEWVLLNHAKISTDKRWKKNVSRLDKRVNG